MLAICPLGGDFRVWVVGPAVQHDVGDGGAEGRHGRELPAVAVHRAGQRAWLVLGPGGAWRRGELAQDRGGCGREAGLAVDGGGGGAGDCVDVVQLLPQGGGFGGPSP